MDKIKRLKDMIDEVESIVAFTGAGVSTDSGLKDFRSKDGLYSESLSAEYMLSSDCFYRHTEDFWDYYKENFNCLKIKPNITHKYLKKLEDIGKLKAIVTQNIDGLHNKAGSKNVLELHGTIYKNHCIDCGKEYDGEYVFKSNGVPKCSCGGIIKPNVVLYGENLNDYDFIAAENYIADADTLIIIGSSLTVYPVAGLVRYFRGKNLVILNRDATDYDSMASLVINDELKNIFNELTC